jgi:hypothetical protein
VGDFSSRSPAWPWERHQRKLTLLGRGLAAFLLALSVTGSEPPPPQPAHPPAALVSEASDRCIDAGHGTGGDGFILQIWDCSGADDQKWVRYSDRTVRLLIDPGMCMEVAGNSTKNRAAIRLASCNGSPAQQFRLEKARDLVNYPADKCVDVKDREKANGTKLQLWTCVGGPNQKWDES